MHCAGHRDVAAARCRCTRGAAARARARRRGSIRSAAEPAGGHLPGPGGHETVVHRCPYFMYFVRPVSQRALACPAPGIHGAARSHPMAGRWLAAGEHNACALEAASWQETHPSVALADGSCPRPPQGLCNDGSRPQHSGPQQPPTGGGGVCSRCLRARAVNVCVCVCVLLSERPSLLCRPLPLVPYMPPRVSPYRIHARRVHRLGASATAHRRGRCVFSLSARACGECVCVCVCVIVRETQSPVQTFAAGALHASSCVSLQDPCPAGPPMARPAGCHCQEEGQPGAAGQARRNLSAHRARIAQARARSRTAPAPRPTAS